MSSESVYKWTDVTIDDGCGETSKCSHPDCDLEVVRPGSVQCSGDTSWGGCTGPRASEDRP